jgi:hypothetical protein
VFWRSSQAPPITPEAGVAQLVEQLIRNQQVIGSSPIAGSTNQSALVEHRSK